MSKLCDIWGRGLKLNLFELRGGYTTTTIRDYGYNYNTYNLYRYLRAKTDMWKYCFLNFNWLVEYILPPLRILVQVFNFLCFDRFPRDVNRRLQWIQALDRERFVPTNNTLICEAHFTTNDYQKRPDLIKLTHTAIPSIFKGRENEKQNASLKKVMDSGLKSSRMPARKRHGNLSDHTYVLKLPEEIIPDVTEDTGFQKSISPSKCVVHTLNACESRVLDISQLNIQTSKNIESNLYLYFIIIQLFLFMYFFVFNFRSKL